MTTQLRRRVALAIGGLVAAVVLAFTLIEPAIAHTGSSPKEKIPPAPTTYYGAIAVAHDGSVGKGLRKRSSALAKQMALRMCRSDTCKVVITFTLCGAVAHDGTTFHGGAGHNRGVAGHDAIARLGGGWVVHTACN